MPTKANTDARGLDEGHIGDFFSYNIFGLAVRSEILLPELGSPLDDLEPDVVIRIGRIPPIAEETVGNFAVAGECGILNVPGAARFLVRAGREIIVEPDPNGSERHLRLYLLGSAMGSLLHQRGLLPLHSNAIEMNGSAFAFMGASGAGKSTMAAWFHDRGYNVLADDVCVVTFQASGSPLAHPGIPRLRLWRDALEDSGRNAEDHEHAFDDADKYNVPTRQVKGRAALPLGGIYLLDSPRSDADSQSVTKLVGLQALEALLANTYRGSYISMLGGTKRHFLQCLQLARQVPSFKLRRVWGFSAFAQQAELLERHAKEVASSSGGATRS
jgi:hypothetical protein